MSLRSGWPKDFVGIVGIQRDLLELLAVLHPLLALSLGHAGVIHRHHGSGVHEKVSDLIVHDLLLIHQLFLNLKPAHVRMTGPGKITKPGNRTRQAKDVLPAIWKRLRIA